VREALNVMGDGRYKDALDKLRLQVMRWSAHVHACGNVCSAWRETCGMPGERDDGRETMRVESDSSMGGWQMELGALGLAPLDTSGSPAFPSSAPIAE
jgi:hypothetical protein